MALRPHHGAYENAPSIGALESAPSVLFFLLLFAFCLPASATTHLHKPVSTGNDFYVVFPKAAWGNQSVGVLINSPTKQKITVTTPSGAKGIVNITDPRTTRYYAGQFRIESEPERILKSEATRIQSLNPISVHGQFGIAGISGTFTALPITSWGKEYYALLPPEGQNSTYNYYPTIYSVPMITLIGSTDGTIVTVTPTANTAKGHSRGMPFDITLNAGDVYNITTTGDPRATVREENQCSADLSGTHIVATEPIGAIVSQSHTSWPCGSSECGDYGVEWLPPLSNWDSVYLVVPGVHRDDVVHGEHFRILFSVDSTTLVSDDFVNGQRTMGTFAAGQIINYDLSSTYGSLLTASHPILLLELGVMPALCQTGASGGQNWNFSMMIPAGVHQWSDYLPFSSAIGSQSWANIVFRYDQLAHLYFNGKPLAPQFPAVKRLGATYATIQCGVNSGTYNEVTGDSGATAGGDIWGYGTLKFTPNNGSKNRVQDPEVVKSFSHPISISGVPLNGDIPDTTPPKVMVSQSCGVWHITATDSLPAFKYTGIYDVALLNFAPPDTIFNVQFNPAPKFAYGTLATSFVIEVINLSQPAQATLHVRDGAGNELDTVLVYIPQVVDAVPNLLELGPVRSLDSVRGMITLHNRSDAAMNFSSYRLKYGASRNWFILRAPNVPASPTVPFIIPAHDSIVFYFQYDGPNGAYELDSDTLFVTTCKEFPIAALVASPRKPSINTACYDFGYGLIDIFNTGGDTLSSTIGGGVWVASVGADTLHISKISIHGALTPAEPGFPASDFWLGKKYYKVGVDAHGKKITTPFNYLPSKGKDPLGVDSTWVLAPQETAFVEVMGHPHHVGVRGGGDSTSSPTNYAYVQFDNDANHQVLDRACLTMQGLLPGILASTVDYGPHLYGTTADSFFVVRNAGQTEFHISKYGFDFGSSADSISFVFHQYRDPVTHFFYGYDITDTAYMAPGDTICVPFRLIANVVGDRVDSINIINSSPARAIASLTARITQPRIDGMSACIPDTVHVGDTISTFMMLHNAGDALLNIDSLEFGGARSDEWTITGVRVPGSNLTLTSPPWKFPLRSTNDSTGEKAYVSLKWIPTTDSAPTAVVRVIGMDSLRRHANDSASATFYKWNVFPYDTVMPIVNLPCLTGVSNQNIVAPTQDILWPNYPNPFSSSTTLSYTLGTSGHVMLRMVNALGETVSMLVNEHQASGTYSVTAKGAGLRAGMYFVELICSGERTARKIIIVQ